MSTWAVLKAGTCPLSLDGRALYLTSARRNRSTAELQVFSLAVCVL